MDEVAGAQAAFLYLYFDEGPGALSWIQGMSGRAPATFQVEYGHVDGERVVRRLQNHDGLDGQASSLAAQS